MIKYEIVGGNLPVVICYPQAGQALCNETGSMSWMSPNMKMETTSGGGIKKVFGRMFSGESLFMNEYTAMGSEGMIAFSASFPGTIIPFHITPNNGLIVQKTGFLAMEKGMELSVYFQKKLRAGFFGGEGFIMQRISGEGMAFIEIDGYCQELYLATGESVIVDTGHLAAMSETCTMDIQRVKGVKNMFFGGEGIFHTVVTGPGKVYLQSMPISNVAAKISLHLPDRSSSHDSDGSGFSIKFGD